MISFYLKWSAFFNRRRSRFQFDWLTNQIFRRQTCFILKAVLHVPLVETSGVCGDREITGIKVNHGRRAEELHTKTAFSRSAEISASHKSLSCRKCRIGSLVGMCISSFSSQNVLLTTLPNFVPA